MTVLPTVDVVLNIFAKPYQTSLSVLSLLRFCDNRIDRLYLQFEPYGSMYDKASPYVVAEYLGKRAIVSQPAHWLELDAPDPEKLDNAAYRQSIRYQYAFEHTDKDFLFVMHNDVLVKKDIIGALLENIDGAFAAGQLGQCWNCPAANAALVREAGLGSKPCTPGSYREFQPDFAGLERLYTLARQHDVFVRPYDDAWHAHYAENAWPLPECRVNEWACLVDMRQTRNLALPHGPVPPFGAYEECGRICLDIAVPWFRELHRQGLFARHVNIEPYLTHWVGTGKMTEYRYTRAEGNARAILLKNFPDFVAWCKKQGNNMF